ATDVDHGADAHRVVVQRDVPEPAVGERGAEEVVRELALEPLRAFEVAVDREVLEEVVEAAEPLRRTHDRRLPARVDQEAWRETHLAAVDAARVDDGRRAAR